MSLTKILISEAVANRRKKEVIQRIAKILYKKHDKKLYNKIRKRLSNNKYLSDDNFYTKVSHKAQQDFKENRRKFGTTLINYNREDFINIHWFICMSFYKVMEQCDPTEKGKYLNWLVSAHLTKEMQRQVSIPLKDTVQKLQVFLRVLGDYGFYSTMIEDIGKVKQTLKTFEKAKELNSLSGQEADINSYDDYLELWTKLRDLKQEDPDMIKSRQEKVMDQSEIIYEDEEWKFIVPKTHEASCTWGSGTNWCTAVDDGDLRTYEGYMERGDLIILINDKKGRKFQSHYETGGGYWFMNEQDEVGIKEFEKLVGNDNFNKYIGIIVYHSSKKYGISIDLLAEFDALCDELNQEGLSKHYLPTDFIGDKPLKIFTKDLIKWIKKEEDPNYTNKGKKIIKLINKYKNKGIRKMWDEIMSEYSHYIINDILFLLSKKGRSKYFKDATKATKNYFKSLTK